jgi:hypothetical protein
MHKSPLEAKKSDLTIKRKKRGRRLSLEAIAGAFVVLCLVLQTFSLWHVHDHLPVTKTLVHKRRLQNTTAKVSLLQQIADRISSQACPRIQTDNSILNDITAYVQSSNSSTKQTRFRIPLLRKNATKLDCTMPETTAHDETTFTILLIVTDTQLSRLYFRLLTSLTLNYLQDSACSQLVVLMQPTTYTLLQNETSYASRWNKWAAARNGRVKMIQAASLVEGLSQLSVKTAVWWVTLQATSYNKTLVNQHDLRVAWELYKGDARAVIGSRGWMAKTDTECSQWKMQDDNNTTASASQRRLQESNQQDANVRETTRFLLNLNHVFVHSHYLCFLQYPFLDRETWIETIQAMAAWLQQVAPVQALPVWQTDASPTAKQMETWRYFGLVGAG